MAALRCSWRGQKKTRGRVEMTGCRMRFSGDETLRRRRGSRLAGLSGLRDSTAPRVQRRGQLGPDLTGEGLITIHLISPEEQLQSRDGTGSNHGARAKSPTGCLKRSGFVDYPPAASNWTPTSIRPGVTRPVQYNSWQPGGSIPSGPPNPVLESLADYRQQQLDQRPVGGVQRYLRA